ncbi:MAG: hypothetical protein AB1456_10030 [Thermodesulfobacteriota bacterium]
MKIQDILQTFKGRGATKATTTANADFQQMLAREIAASAAANQASAETPITAASQVPATLRLQGLELTENTLSTLDSFGAALGNTALKHDDLEPYVAALEEDVAALLETKNQIPGNDPLAKLLDRVATVSYLETVKYRRGDYA